ncbi:MAG: hypothetical protein EOO43_06215, partial [Flavobacterium sp.]
PEFTELIPTEIAEGVIYISIPHCVAIHKCACGCGLEVITPFHPIVGWKLIFDGASITLRPSIGNWNFPCQSHYFITDNEIIHCVDRWDEEADITDDKDPWWRKLFGFNKKQKGKNW